MTWGGTYVSCIRVRKFLSSIPKSEYARARGVCAVKGPACCDLLVGQQPLYAPSQRNWVKTSPCSGPLNSGRPTRRLGPLDQVPGQPAVATPLQPQMPQKRHLAWHREKGKGHELRENNPEGGLGQTPRPEALFPGRAPPVPPGMGMTTPEASPGWEAGSVWMLLPPRLRVRRPHLTEAAAGLQEPRNLGTPPAAPGTQGPSSGPGFLVPGHPRALCPISKTQTNYRGSDQFGEERGYPQGCHSEKSCLAGPRPTLSLLCPALQGRPVAWF